MGCRENPAIACKCRRPQRPFYPSSAMSMTRIEFLCCQRCDGHVVRGPANDAGCEVEIEIRAARLAVERPRAARARQWSKECPFTSDEGIPCDGCQSEDLARTIAETP